MLFFNKVSNHMQKRTLVSNRLKQVSICELISSSFYILIISPGSRHIGEGDIVVADAAKTRQDLGKRGHNKVLPVPESNEIIAFIQQRDI